MTSESPEQYLRRSQLYRLHQQAGARFTDCEGALCVSQYRGNDNEVGQAQSLGLADLSMLPRIGFKGSGAPDWLHKHGAQLPVEANHALVQKGGSLLARLSEHEVLILHSLMTTDAMLNELQNDLHAASAQYAYLLPRADSHCWLALSGEHAVATLAKVCAVDLRLHTFAQGEVAQTSMARVNAIVIRNDLGLHTPCFYILCDVSLAEFLWESLIDAMQEFGGQPVGLIALKHLQLTDII